MTLPSAPAAVHPVWPAAATLGEGCCWSERSQLLWWVDILEHRVHCWRPSDQSRRSWTLPDTVSAVAERRHASGLVITLRRGLAFFDPDTGTLERGVEPETERSGNRFNDGKCDSRGRFWGGTMDFACEASTGALYCFDNQGARRALDIGIAVTNGPAWSADGRTMFLNDTTRGRVLAMPFDVDTGQLGEPREFLRFGPQDGLPDGMTTDSAGRLWIAHWGGWCVTAHDTVTGAELRRITLPTAHITSIAFGGPDLRTMFVTSARFGLGAQDLALQPLAGALFAVDAGISGAPAHLFDG